MANTEANTKAVAASNISQVLANIETELAERESQNIQLRGELSGLAFDIESGDADAKRRAAQIRNLIAENDTRIEELRAAKSGGRPRLDIVRKREADERRVAEWRRVLEILTKREELVGQLDVALVEAGKLAGQVYALGNAAHGIAARNMSADQVHACAPSAEYFALSLFGTFLRVSQLPDSFVRDLSELGLDKLSHAEPPSQAVAFQNDRIRDRLPPELQNEERSAA